MAVIDPIKEKAGKFYLAKAEGKSRDRFGSNFHTANTVGLIYRYEDESHFKRIERFARSLQEEFGVKRVFRLAYVNESEKNTPHHLMKKLDSTFITRDDLNWHLKPVKGAEDFSQISFDILINLQQSPNIPISYLMRSAKAGMIAGCTASADDNVYDLLLDLEDNTTMESYWEQLKLYLSNKALK